MAQTTTATLPEVLAPGRLFIDNEWVDAASGKTFEVVNPALGEVLTTCVSLMNPSVIVLGGAMAEAGEHLIAGVREVVYRRSMPLATESLHITLSQTGADAAVLGAAGALDR